MSTKAETKYDWFSTDEQSYGLKLLTAKGVLMAQVHPFNNGWRGILTPPYKDTDTKMTVEVFWFKERDAVMRSIEDMIDQASYSHEQGHAETLERV